MNKLERNDLLNLFGAACRLRLENYASSSQQRRRDIQLILATKEKYRAIDTEFFRAVSNDMYDWDSAFTTFACGRFVDDMYIFSKYIGISREELSERYVWDFDLLQPSTRSDEFCNYYKALLTRQSSTAATKSSCCLL